MFCDFQSEIRVSGNRCQAFSVKDKDKRKIKESVIVLRTDGAMKLLSRIFLI